jgi:3-oxoadipate CoA-transferase beta subunit
MTATPLTREEIAGLVASEIEPGWIVNLGIGMPTLVSGHPIAAGVVFHSENGVLGVGPPPAPGSEDEDLINASKDPITLLPGGSFFSHTDSFAMIRGGHIDLAIMGAFEVSSSGDLANWSRGSATVPAVGGAMDLAVSARRVFVMMTHCATDGTPKLVEDCAYPLTANGVVSRVYTDLAVLEPRDGRFVALSMVDTLTFAELQAVTAAPLLDETRNRNGAAP